MSAPRLLITGGRQRSPLHLREMREWSLFDRAVLLELDTGTGEVQVRLSYTSPPEHAPAEDPSFIFKAASTDGERLAVVTQTEVLILNHSSLEVQSVLSHPYFNDLHHAAWIDGRLEVVSTGLDRLIGFGSDDEILSCRTVLPDHPEEEQPIDEGTDYRLIPTTKPHASHPNFVFRTEAGTWVTRFEQRDAICLDDPALRFPIDLEKPHDGVHHDGAVWFTTVDGQLTAFDSATCERVATIDLASSLGMEGPLGWCRGLHFDGGIAYVGFSRIRATRFRRNLSWIKHGFRESDGYTSRATRILAFDLAEPRVVGEWDLEPHGINAVFGVLGA